HKNHHELKTHKLQPGTRATPTHEQQHQRGLDREQFQWLAAARTTHEQQRQLPEARAVPAASGRQFVCSVPSISLNFFVFFSRNLKEKSCVYSSPFLVAVQSLKLLVALRFYEQTAKGNSSPVTMM
ncbi:hypothetical protein CUMW_190780, partial [Citrus unshiu]